MKNKILIINHVFWPDNHNTARHISELSEELVKRGWDVQALISNRSYTDHNKKFKDKRGIWKGVKYYRVNTPKFNQKNNLQRLLTSVWLIISWSLHIPFLGKFNAIIIGTNPPFAYILAPFIHLFNRKAKLLMWGFDLYPEAIIVSGGYFWINLGKIFEFITKICYKFFDVIVDIGPCMREKLLKYRHRAKVVTLTPWSFVEPQSMPSPDLKTRTDLFGDANLTILYSGTIGNAHEFDNFLRLARECRLRNSSIAFCFAGFGNKFKDLKSQVSSEDSNITFAGFVQSDEELKKRLSSADLMMISLKENWTGISVPSKFFGAIASGQAVLFSGSKNSSIAHWIRKFNLGFQISNNNILEIVELLLDISKDKNRFFEMKLNAFNSYREFFSKKIICDHWSELLYEIIQ